MRRILGMGFILMVLLGYALQLAYQHAVDTPIAVAETVFVDVNKGDSLRRIIDELTRHQILRRPTWFMVLAYSRGVAGKIKAGEYSVPPGITPRELLAKMVSGRVHRHVLTLVEGWTFKQALEAVWEHRALAPTLGDADDGEIMARIGAREEKPEGLFFPDTYFFTKGTSDVEILGRAYRHMRKILEREWAERAEGLPLADPYQALILASIVEKETGLASERAKIAGVFVRRLQQGMRLQTDPSVIYGLGESFTGDLRRRDLGEDNFYNTYLHRGLPPTPIALPGRASIHAALHPAGGDELYFVAREDGSHVFSSTLDEHNRAVKRYQLQKTH